MFTGLGLGLAGGVAPGPLTSLVLSHTIQHGRAAGIRVAMAPLLTDGPMLLGSAFLAHVLTDTAMAVINICGAVFLVMLGVESLRSTAIHMDQLSPPSGGMLRAVMTNLLNPHPYLFWITVGGPLFAAAADDGVLTMASFLIGFFGGLCGAKVAMACLIEQARPWLSGRAYTGLLRVLGVTMWIFAAGFLHNAWSLLMGT